VDSGKAVFATEYTDSEIKLDDVCPQATALQISLLRKNRKLDAFRELCPPLPV
jgi:hypothetical protein